MISYVVCVRGFGLAHALARDMTTANKTRNEMAAEYRAYRQAAMARMKVSQADFDAMARTIAIELADGEEVEPRHYVQAALEMARPCPCATCGVSPCYNICPTQDPWNGDRQAEHDDHEFHARYDDVRERFSS